MVAVMVKISPSKRVKLKKKTEGDTLFTSTPVTTDSFPRVTVVDSGIVNQRDCIYCANFITNGYRLGRTNYQPLAVTTTSGLVVRHPFVQETIIRLYINFSFTCGKQVTCYRSSFARSVVRWFVPCSQHDPL